MNKNACIGIDIGGTNTRLALVTKDGAVGKGARFSSRGFACIDDFLHKIVEECQALRDQSLRTGVQVASIGVGVPGPVDPEGRILAAPNLSFLNGVDFSKHLTQRLNMPVAVMNDANAIAWGEKTYGSGRDFSSLLTVTLGTGVGGGLIFKDRLWIGADGCAGEFGHMNVEPEGHPCGCGSRGCLEQYASATGLLRTVGTKLEQGHFSTLANIHPNERTAEAIGQAARSGDALALEVLAGAGQKLGLALAGIANLLNLNAVVICGGVATSLDLMLPSLLKELCVRAFERPAQRLHIVAGTLGDHAGILGAAHFSRNPRVVWD